MKIENWPTAIVVAVGALTSGAVVVLLANAGWKSESIIAFGTLVIGVFAGQAVTARKLTQVTEKTDAQTEQLATVVEQTNGMHSGQLASVAETAAARAIVKYEARQRQQSRGPEL